MRVLRQRRCVEPVNFGELIPEPRGWPAPPIGFLLKTHEVCGPVEEMQQRYAKHQGVIWLDCHRRREALFDSFSDRILQRRFAVLPLPTGNRPLAEIGSDAALTEQNLDSTLRSHMVIENSGAGISGRYVTA